MFLVIFVLTLVLAIVLALVGLDHLLLDWTLQSTLLSVLVLAFLLDKWLEHKVDLW